MTTSVKEKKGVELKGIDGWLWVLAFTFIVRIFSFSYAILSRALEWSILQDGTLFPSGLDYLYSSSFALSALGLCSSIVLFTLFCKKKTSFVKLMIAYLVVSGIVLFGGFAYEFQGKILSGPLGLTLLAMLIPSALWIAYLFRSKRVKNTFVN